MRLIRPTSAHQVQLAALATAQAQLELTQLSMTDAVVRSPISGTVSKRHVQPGEKVSFDAPLLSIVDLAQLEVQAQVPISDVTQIRKGMPTHVDVEGIDGRKFEGRVERINPSAEPGTRTINIYVSLANEDSLLKTGMFARVLLTISPEARSARAAAIGRAHRGRADLSSGSSPMRNSRAAISSRASATSVLSGSR